jgi:radical SAM superfamily enzyme YgiQ (UPF0313 family)
MIIRLFFPKWEKLLENSFDLEKTIPGYDVGHFKMPGLSLPTLIAAGPEDIQYELVDEHIETIDFDNLDYDVAAISFFTPQATRAYQIANEIRRRGKTVVMGGIHPTLMPEEAMLHANAVCAGMAEVVWPKMLSDFKKGQLEPFYDGRQIQPQFSEDRLPDRTIWQKKGYVQIGVVQISRGCLKQCPFCVLPEFSGKTIHYKRQDRLLEEIQSLTYPSYYIADENILFSSQADTEFSYSFLEKLAHLKRSFFIASYPFIVNSAPERLIEAAAQAGLKQVYLVVGLDRDSEKMYENNTDSVISAIGKLKKYGIAVMMSVGVGGDSFQREHFKWLGDFCNETEVDLTEFYLHTPFPKTQLRNKLQAQGRLLSQIPWSQYNGAHPTFQPMHMSVEECREGYLQLWIDYYSQFSRGDILRRIMKCFEPRIVKEAQV